MFTLNSSNIMCVYKPLYIPMNISLSFYVALALRICIVRDLRKVEGGLHHHNAISLAGCRGQWGCGVTGLISMTKTKKSQAATTQQKQQQQQQQRQQEEEKQQQQQQQQTSPNYVVACHLALLSAGSICALEMENGSWGSRERKMSKERKGRGEAGGRVAARQEMTLSLTVA